MATQQKLIDRMLKTPFGRALERTVEAGEQLEAERKMQVAALAALRTEDEQELVDQLRTIEDREQEALAALKAVSVAKQSTHEALNYLRSSRESRIRRLEYQLRQSADPRLAAFLGHLGVLARHRFTHPLLSDEEGEYLREVRRVKPDPTSKLAEPLPDLERREAATAEWGAFQGRLESAMSAVRDLQLLAAPDVAAEISKLIGQIGPAPCQCAPQLVVPPEETEVLAIGAEMRA